MLVSFWYNSLRSNPFSVILSSRIIPTTLEHFFINLSITNKYWWKLQNCNCCTDLVL